VAVGGSAADRAYKEIKRQLLRGSIEPGVRIAVEDICEKMGVSRTPVREALVALESEGLVRAVPRRGYFAREISFREALDAYQLRMIFEPIATALAARRIRTEDLAAVKELADLSTDGSEESIERALEQNRQFHLRICQATGNARLTRIMADLMDDIERLLYIELDSQHTEADWRAEHQAIVDALEAHDPAAAAAAAQATFTSDSGFLSLQAKSELTSLLGTLAPAPPEHDDRASRDGG
jgi:DNA-binding GntR family transcriptional regulator